LPARRRNARAPLSTRNLGPPPRLVTSRPVPIRRGVRTHSRLNPSSPGRGNACRSILENWTCSIPHAPLTDRTSERRWRGRDWRIGS